MDAVERFGFYVANGRLWPPAASGLHHVASRLALAPAPADLTLDTRRARQLGLTLSLGRRLAMLAAALGTHGERQLAVLGDDPEPSDGDPAELAVGFASALGTALAAPPADERGHDTGPAAATAQAVRFFREAARQEPAHYLPDLAAALRHHTQALSEAGLAEDALGAAQDAVTVLQHLAQQDPAGSLPALADALHDLAERLDAGGRGRDAMIALEDAVIIRRHLARCLPDRFLPDLAASLHALSLGLGATGQEHEALAVLNEAVAIRRLLADGDGRHLPDLATSLQALSVGLGALGQQPEGLAVGREATQVLRVLAQHDPTAHVDGLADAVENLAISLGAMGRHDEGRAASEDAAALRRHLVALPQQSGCCCPCHAPAAGTVVDTVAVTGPTPAITQPDATGSPLRQMA